MKSYEAYSREELITRIIELENRVSALSPSGSTQTQSSAPDKHSFKTEYAGKILDSLPDMLSVINFDGVYVDLVSSDKTIHVGDSFDNMIGKNIENFLPRDAYHSIKTNLDIVKDTGHASVGSHHLYVNGKTHYYENRIIPLDEQNTLCICRDITETITARTELEFVKSAVYNAIEEIYASTLDGSLVFANKQFINHYCVAGEISDHKIYDIYEEADTDIWAEHIRQLQKQKGSMKFVTRHKNYQQQSIPLEITTYIIKDHNHQEIIWAFARDISESQAQENKIRELNFLMDTILNNVPVYLFVKDTGNNFRYLYWNKAFEDFSHIPAKQAIGHTDAEIFQRPQDIEQFKRDDLRLLKAGEKIEYQEEYHSATGETRIVNTIKTLVHNNNKPPLIIGISWDITELKTTEQALIQARINAEESDRLKSAFLANMSHEIRTPLNAIVGFSRLMAESENTSDQQQYFNIIEKNTSLLLQLINDILDLSKIEAGMLEFVKRKINLRELCRSIYDIHLSRTPQNVELIFEDAGIEITTGSDQNRLSQVLSNLITNAQKFTVQGQISFGFIPQKKNIEFYVRDTGIGIAEKNINKIFNRFTKLNTFAQGTGLGLAISQMIVKNLGGHIWVESLENQGSTFHFTIPYQEINEEKNEITFLKSGKIEDAAKNILIAEDVESNFLLLKALIGKRYHITRAHNGVEAVNLFRQHKPDIILMDIKMPEMDGLEATRQIRKESKDTIIIALTAFAFESDKTAALEAGANEFVTKPISSQVLRNMIEKYI